MALNLSSWPLASSDAACGLWSTFLVMARAWSASLVAVHALAEPVGHLEDIAEADADLALPLPTAIPPGREGQLDRAVLIGLDDEGRNTRDLSGIARRLDAEREGFGVLDTAVRSTACAAPAGGASKKTKFWQRAVPPTVSARLRELLPKR